MSETEVRVSETPKVKPRPIVRIGSFLISHSAFVSLLYCRKKMERYLAELICSFFVASWTGVVKYHGPRPSRRPQQVFVSNHTSMIDFIVLEQMTAFAVIMQKHPGWVGKFVRLTFYIKHPGWVVQCKNNVSTQIGPHLFTCRQLLAKLNMDKDAADMLNEAAGLEEKKQRGGRGS